MRPAPVATAGLLLCAALRAAPVPPQPSGSLYVFAFPSNGPRLEVDPAVGGRISSLKLGTQEFLFVNRSQDNWGSTFWTSPQSVWNWPPPHALNQGAFAAAVRQHTLELVGAQDGQTQFAFLKRFSAEDGDTSFQITLGIRNGASAPKQAAPWQITRVLPGGLTFFPKGPGPARGDLLSDVKEMGGWMWFDYATAKMQGGIPKYFGDGADGWMAHVDPGGLLLLEVFPDIPAQEAAPEEAEIELYTDPGRQYMEIEHQGRYAAIPAGDTAFWTTRWYLRRLPSGIPRKAGDPKLVEYVTSLLRIAKGPSPIRARAPRGPRRTALPTAAPTPVFPVPGGGLVDPAGRGRP